jgi:hypothetical protein
MRERGRERKMGGGILFFFNPEFPHAKPELYHLSLP